VKIAKKGKPVKENVDLKDITTYKNVGVTELRDNLRDFIEDSDTSPIVVSQRGKVRKVIVDYETWIQLLRNSDTSGNALVQDELAAVLRKLINKAD
jgi:PHD/YefM family antitoxin component YafN of YafNO toxin-antitoxin module